VLDPCLRELSIRSTKWAALNLLPQQPASNDSEPLQLDSNHYRMLYTSFSLFMMLYLPEPAFERIPVGDDLMEWLNIHFIEPTTEEGDHLSGLERPWEDESFWPYLTRSVSSLILAFTDHPKGLSFEDFPKRPRSFSTFFVVILQSTCTQLQSD
jgi:hypothetical protein